MVDENYFEVLFSTTKDDELDYLDISATLIMKNLENEDEESVGYANIYMFNEYRVNSWDDLIYDDEVVQNEDKAIEYYINKGFKPISRRVGGNVVMGKSLMYIKGMEKNRYR